MVSQYPVPIPQQPAAATQPVEARVDAYMEAQVLERRGTGLALGVVKGGALVKATGYGLASVELGVPVVPATVFEIGSLTKQFVATAVMMLVEAGGVKLDDPVARYFPEAPASWKDITVRRLLGHTSGLPDYLGLNGDEAKAVVDVRKDYTEAELLDRLFTLSPGPAPGTKYRYSNTNYVLLGILIRRVTGQSYGDFLRQRIFQPLGMAATRVVSEADIVPGRAAGYRLVDGELANQEWVSPTLNALADGGLCSTVLDLAKWDAALSTERILRKASLEQMWTPVELASGETVAHGFGWNVTRWNGHRLLQHVGEWLGFTAAMCRFPDDHLTVIVLTNLYVKGSHQEVVALTVAGLYLA